jgi:4-amino-4-deoxy-L-arabinose transferase-like glycosyltransferase
MKNLKLTRNPYLLFSPFLLLFIVIVFRFHSDTFKGDESGYLYFATNLLEGFYSPPAPAINLWWGPGYPMLLVPFTALRLPLNCIILMNAVFQYLSIVLLFKATLYFVGFRKALIISLFWAFCFSSYRYLAFILTEPFTIFLIALLVLSLTRAFKDQINKYVFISGFILGYIALTKVIFGYVILFLLIWNIILLIKNRKENDYRKTALILLIAFTTVMPYLLYTYNLTGRLYYWGNSGGMSLYWMSNPYENEYGSWVNEKLIQDKMDPDLECTTALLKMNHQKDINEILKYQGVERDDAYKRIAIQNIKNHPVKYFKNIVANISNLLFDFPQTYTYQRTILKIWYFSIFFTLMLISFILTIINWRGIPFYIKFIIVFAFIYIGGSSLVSVANRQFVIIMPALLVWIAYVFDKSILVKIKFDKNTVR